MSRRSLRPQLNQIRGWVRQGRTDAWIAHQLEVTVQQIQAFKREQGLEPDAEENGAVPVGLQAVLALEGLDLLDGHLKLMGDPCVGATLSHPPTDLVKLGTQGPATHERAGRLAQEGSGASGAGPIGDTPNEH